jgi:hypothetical protein
MKTSKILLLIFSFIFIFCDSNNIIGQGNAPQKQKQEGVALKIPGIENVIVKKDVPYLSTPNSTYKMDIYYPPKFDFTKKIPAIIFLSGAPDSSMIKLVGSPFKNFSQYTSWCKLVAASGMAAIVYETVDPKNDLISLAEYLYSDKGNLSIDKNRLGAFVCSGHTPSAISYILSSSSMFSCAALFYGFVLTSDFENISTVESMFKQMGFQNPPVLTDPINWKKEVNLLIVRAGQDKVPFVNQSMQNFINLSIKQNLPITLINYPDGPHSFDVNTDNETTSRIILNTLEFWKQNLKVK